MPRKFRYTHEKYYFKKSKKQGPLKLDDLHASVDKLAPGWVDQTSDPTKQIQLCKIVQSPQSSKHPMVISHCLCICSDLTWEAHIHRHKTVTNQWCKFTFILCAYQIGSAITYITTSAYGQMQNMSWKSRKRFFCNGWLSQRKVQGRWWKCNCLSWWLFSVRMAICSAE